VSLGCSAAMQASVSVSVTECESVPCGSAMLDATWVQCGGVVSSTIV